MASVAVLSAVVVSLLMSTPGPEFAATSPMIEDDVPEPADRLAFVHPDAFLEPIIGIAVLPDVVVGEQPSDTPSTWTTETRRAEAAATPVVALRPTKLPPLHVATALPAPASPLRAGPRSLKTDYTLKARLAELSPAATLRLAAKFEEAKVAWPPSEIALVTVKDERTLELHARQAGGPWKFVHRYRVLAASGHKGPKLVQGDKQVPEGIYAISFLNPNSAYHVSMRVNYPNAFDRRMAQTDGRKQLGGDIMIHGKNLSAGCLAMGDEAVEELFVLAAQTGLSKVKLVIAPTDFRRNGMPQYEPGQPLWLPKLYAEIATTMAEFKAPPPPARATGLLSFFMKSSQ